MTHFFDRFRIPTLLGLGILLSGIIAGVLLTLNQQIFLIRATPENEPKNITLSNISETGLTISWETSSEVISSISFGQNTLAEKTASDDQDNLGPNPRQIHYISLKNLLPKTIYKYQITSSSFKSKVSEFQTTSPASSQTGFGPIIGTVLDGESPLSEGIVYLTIPQANIQSSLIKEFGSFLIPLNSIRTTDLADIYHLTEETVAKIKVVSPRGEASATFKLKTESVQLPPMKLGENLDLIIMPEIKPEEASPSAQELIQYDLNDDGKINAADNAVILNNFGNPPTGGPKEKRADLNQDGIVDEKDLELMSKQINQ